MKKITLLLIFSLLSFSCYSQMALEGFESTTGPNALPSTVWPLGTGNWAVFDNGVGLGQRWGINSTVQSPPLVYAGANAAYINRDQNGAGNTSEDYLATPAVNIPTNGQLRFFTRSFTNGNQGTIYQIKIAPATASQTDPAAYTLVKQFTEDELSAVYNVYEEKIVDLPASTYNGSYYVAFVKIYAQPALVTQIGGDRWLVDNARITPKCLAPTNIVFSNPTLDGGTLTWANPGGASAWELEVIPATATPTGIPNYTAGPTPTKTITGLMPSTAYKVYIRALCSGALPGDPPVSSAYTAAFNFTTASPGLTCASPVFVTTLPYITNTNTNAFGDTTDVTQPLPCAGTVTNYMTGNDAFYSYTATSTIDINVTLTPTGGGSGLFIYQGCANVGVTCVGGAANSGSGPRNVVFTPVAGQTYIIVVSSNAAVQQTFPYNLTILQNSCTNLAATFAKTSNCTTTTTGFFVTANVSSLGTATSVVATDNQSSPSQTIFSAPGTFTFGPYPNGTNVTLHLENGSDPNCFINSASFTQQFCPFTNDLCSNAIPVTCGGVQTQTTVGATTTGAPTTACGTSGTGGSGGLWYSYLGNGDVVTASLCNSTFDTKIQVVTGSCGAFTCVTGNNDSCALQSSVQFITTPGVTYYIYVYGNGTAQGVFTLNITCITPPPPPVNDNCATATVVPVNTDGVCTQTVNGTVAGALASSEPNACVGTADDDVWYQFTATATKHIISLTNIVGSTTDLNFAVYSTTNQASPCGALTQILCSNPNLNVATGLTIGNVYLIRVYTAVNTLLQNTTFTLCVSSFPPPPVNDECATAAVLTLNPNTACGITASGTLTSATASPNPPTTTGCGNVGAANDDVWFQFVAQAPIQIITLSNIVSNTTTNLIHTLYSGTCGALTQIYCSDPDTSTTSNLVIGQTYYIRVYSASTAANEITNFNICIGRPVQCSDAQSFCAITAPYPNTTNVASQGAIGCLLTTPNAGWYTMEVDQSGSLTYTISQTSLAGNPVDVDYILWGPFTPAQNAERCNNLYGYPATNTSVPDNQDEINLCSYSAAAVETFTIPNALAGNFYVIMITNYSNQPGNITFAQTAGTGSTSCCNVTLPVDQVLCDQSSYTITATVATPPTSIKWYNGATEIIGQTGLTLTVIQSGTYTCKIECGVTLREDSINVTFNTSTPATFTQIAPICQNSTAPILPTTSLENVTGTWNPATINTAVTGTLTYTFSPTTGSCATGTTMDITVNPNLVPTFNPIGNVCQGATAPTLPSTSIEGISGTWNPLTIDTSTASTVTYTFTPTSGLCASTATLNVTVTGSITTTFAQIPNICQNSTAPTFLTTSQQGVTGSWNAPINTSTPGTTNYTFTPDASYPCATTFVMPITIDLRVIPTFNAIPNLCLNDVAPTLPTTSNNGITGTWNNAISTTSAGTTTYTFTPDAGICATTATLNVTVLSPTVPTFTQLGPFCQFDTAPTLPTSSLNGIVGSWNASVSTSTAGSTTYTFTPNSLVCTSTTTMTIVVNPKPVLPTYSPVVKCDSYVLPALPANTTYNTASNGSGTTLAAGSSVTTSQLIYVYAVSGTTPNCTAEESFNVTITKTPQFEINGGCVNNAFVLESVILNNSFNASDVTYSWTDTNNVIVGTQSTYTATTSGIYTLTVSVPSSTCTDSHNYNAEQTACVIQKGISPNGDGLNDSLDLTGFNVKELGIFNRYGLKVYSKTDYTNQWFGQTDKGDELPDGTYYFVIDRKDASTKSGWVYINRNK